MLSNRLLSCVFTSNAVTDECTQRPGGKASGNKFKVRFSFRQVKFELQFHDKTNAVKGLHS